MARSSTESRWICSVCIEAFPDPPLQAEVAAAMRLKDECNRQQDNHIDLRRFDKLGTGRLPRPAGEDQAASM